VVEEITNEKRISKGFIITIILGILAIGIQCLLIVMIPRLQPRTWSSSQLSLDGNNFFYKWEYREDYDTLTMEYEYNIYSFTGYIGFYLLGPVYLVLLFLSGSGILNKNFKETRTLTYLNWGLYLLPIIIYIIEIVSHETHLPYVPWKIGDPLNFLGFCQLYINLPLQIYLLVKRKTTKEWVKSYWTNEKSAQSKAAVIWSKIYFIIFALHYLAMWVMPIYISHQNIIDVLFIVFGIFFGCLLGWMIIDVIVQLIFRFIVPQQIIRKMIDKRKIEEEKLDALGIEGDIFKLERKCKRLKYTMIALFILIIIVSICVGASACGLIFLFVWVPICGAAILTIFILLPIWFKRKKELAIKTEEMAEMNKGVENNE